MILIDAGNTRAHVWHEGRVEHLSLEEAIARYHARSVAYINVNPHHADLLSAIASWHDLSGTLHIGGEYDGMGIDRKALCLSHDEGIFVDAGSAITVDKVLGGVYQGGFVLPGFHAYRRMYAAISPVLDVELASDIDLSKLPKTTQNSVSFGTMAPIVAAINQLRGDLPLYITGGDGEVLARHFPDAVYDEALVFRGMKNEKENKTE